MEVSPLVLKVTSVRGGENTAIESDKVTFEVVEGTPTDLEVANFINAKFKSCCSINYYPNKKIGDLYDLNFEFSKGQIIS